MAIWSRELGGGGPRSSNTINAGPEEKSLSFV